MSVGKPKAKITWYRNNKEVYGNNKNLISYENGAACLSLAPSELSDAGKYRCEAVNKLGRIQTEAVLTVLSKYSVVKALIHLLLIQPVFVPDRNLKNIYLINSMLIGRSIYGLTAYFKCNLYVHQFLEIKQFLH